MQELIHKSRPGAGPDSPLVFFVHGRAGSLTVMSTFTRAVPESWHVVFVEAPVSDPIGGFSWWDINNPEGKAEQRLRSLALLTAFINGYATAHQLSPSRTVAFGFSQGAAMLSILMQQQPQTFSAVALLSGFVIQQEQIPPGPYPAIFVAHGMDDQVITIEHALEGVQFLEEHGFKVTIQTEAVGHKVGIQGMRALREWVGRLEQ